MDEQMVGDGEDLWQNHLYMGQSTRRKSSQKADQVIFGCKSLVYTVYYVVCSIKCALKPINWFT